MNRIFAFLAAVISVSSADAQQRDPYIWAQYHIEHITKTDLINELRNGFRACLDNEVCGGVVAAGETAVGIPPGSTAMTVQAVDSYGLGPASVSAAGFQRVYDWYQPVPGYSVCRVGAYVQSYSASGSKPGEIWISAKRDYLRAMTFVDDPNIFQGERHVKAWMNVTYARDDIYDLGQASSGCNVLACWDVGLYVGGGATVLTDVIGTYPPLPVMFAAYNGYCPGRTGF